MFAWIFPGQGSQSQGMLAECADKYPEVKATFKEASDYVGFDLWDIIENDPEALKQTDVTQPAILTASVALWRIWSSISGEKAAYVAGHSLGEYSACVVAGALPFAEAVPLVRKRGQLMQQAVPEGQGAMAVVLGLDDAAVEALCEVCSEGQVLSAVNYNSPGQVVVSGEAPAVERFIAEAKPAGARRAMIIPVSVPSHCALMKPAADAFIEALEACNWSAPHTPIIHNVDAAIHETKDAMISVLAQQLYQPVRWVSCVEALAERGVDTYVECGPGKVLTGLNKRIFKEKRAVALNTCADFDTLPGTLGGQEQ